MAFYDLSKASRQKLVKQIHNDILTELTEKQLHKMLIYFGDEDTYIRKAAYQSLGRIYTTHPECRPDLTNCLNSLLQHDSFLIRQTVINAAGEIGKTDFDIVQSIFDTALFDIHHSPRNAVIGSVKKMGEVNPIPVLCWAKKYLHHPDKEIRREICHGIELRGRKYPQDVLPLLKELEFDDTERVRSTLMHVIGQIAYKKGCLHTVVTHLKSWTNKKLVDDALTEIIDVHQRYADFAILSQEEAIAYIEKHFER